MTKKKTTRSVKTAKPAPLRAKRIRRIKLAVVGSISIDPFTAKKLATAILNHLKGRYVISTLVTIKEDPIGLAMRKAQPDIVNVTYSERRYADQSDPDVLAAASVFWASRNTILVDSGERSYAHHLKEIIDRHPGRNYRLLEV